MFPWMRAQHPDLAPIFDRLSADHRHIDPLLACRGTRRSRPWPPRPRTRRASQPRWPRCWTTT